MSNELLIDFGQQTDDRKKWMYEVFYKRLLTEDGKQAFRDRIRCDVVDYCWHCAEAKRWKGYNRFQQWAEQLNAVGERLRSFRQELEQQQMMKYQEVRFNLISFMKTVANTPGSMH